MMGDRGSLVGWGDRQASVKMGGLQSDWGAGRYCGRHWGIRGESEVHRGIGEACGGLQEGLGRLGGQAASAGGIRGK